MTLRDRNFSDRGLANRLAYNVPLIPTASKTKRPYVVGSPGVPFEVVEAYISSIAYTADLDLQLVLAGLNEIFSSPTLAIGALPEDFGVAAFVARVNGQFIEKAADTAISFTAAHKITALKFGAIRVQMDTAGAVSTKVVNATQAYDTEGAARAAIPAADAGKLAIGKIVIEAGAADWDANTDDMTPASDLTAVAFESEAVSVADVLAATISPVALKKSAGTLHATAANWRDSTGLKDIVALATTDANIVLTNGVLHVVARGIGTR